jgi:hypothetical protein
VAAFQRHPADQDFHTAGGRSQGQSQRVPRLRI